MPGIVLSTVVRGPVPRVCLGYRSAGACPPRSRACPGSVVREHLIPNGREQALSPYRVGPHPTPWHRRATTLYNRENREKSDNQANLIVLTGVTVKILLLSCEFCSGPSGTRAIAGACPPRYGFGKGFPFDLFGIWRSRTTDVRPANRENRVNRVNPALALLILLISC